MWWEMMWRKRREDVEKRCGGKGEKMWRKDGG
jgi:hypothetical protein